jgi:ATP-dependent DNA ligase
VVGGLAALSCDRLVLDGELVVQPSDASFDFAALMARLHPAASRVARLAQETPATYVAFDLVALGASDLRAQPFGQRRAALAELLDDPPPRICLTPATDDFEAAMQWLERFTGSGIDGVVAKERGMSYLPGARAMLKVKRERTADCVVAGCRAAPDPVEITSLLLGLYDDADALVHVGVVASFRTPRRRELAHELAPLVVDLEGHPWEHGFLLAGGPMGRLKGAAGRWDPATMEPDWIPLEPTRVCEVAYTQVDGRRFRHAARFRRWRPDRDPRSCRVDQLEPDGR